MKAIKEAAIYLNGMIHTGKRHKDISIKIHKTIGSRKGAIEGFVTNQGIFLDRKEAADLAYQMGQISEPVEELKSEHLY